VLSHELVDVTSLDEVGGILTNNYSILFSPYNISQRIVGKLCSVVGIHLPFVIPAVGGGGPSPPFVIPAGRWQGSIRNEDQIDARLKMSGMTEFLRWELPIAKAKIFPFCVPLLTMPRLLTFLMVRP